jgi:hypothetical protein
MSRQFTAEELISLIRKNGGFTDLDTEGTGDDDLLQYVNEELLGLYAEVAQLHENYFVMTDRIPMVAGKSKYRIPHRAMFQKIRNIQGVSSDGNTYPIGELSRENTSRLSTTTSSTPEAFYVESNYICIWPEMSSAEGSVDVSYLFRPGELVYSTECRQITNVSLTTGVVTIDSVPDGFTESVLYDVHDQYSGASPKAWGLTCSDLTGNLLTFTPTDIDGSVTGRFPVEVGDWICVAETAALPGLPRELHPIIAQAVVVRIVEKKDPDHYQTAVTEFQRMLARQAKVLAMRVEGPGIQVSAYGCSPFFGR